MKSDFFARRALLILCVLFFLVPFAMRGARMSWERMENNVKDWLPQTLEETQELAWFGRHFINEQASVVLSWDGCSDQDESYRLFVQKLRNEIRPENEALIGGGPIDGVSHPEGQPAPDRSQQRARELTRGRQIGDQLGLYATGEYYANWGGQNEKWLRGTGQSWYYITPDGELYRWNDQSHVLGALVRLFQRKVFGSLNLNGTMVAQLGERPTAHGTNGFHDDPQRLVARVLRSVATGPEMLATLSAPGGPLWSTDEKLTDEERARLARRAALDRLQGTFFGPEPYAEFTWSADDLPRVLRPATLAQLPQDWRTKVTEFIATLVSTQYGGERSELQAESLLNKEVHWNAMFAALGTDPPGLQTCVLVTLSDPGMKDLDRVLGRGLFGQTRGKLVTLAAESGVSAPPHPALFSLRKLPEATGKALRMGGPAADNVAFDEEGQITLVRLAAALAALSLLLGGVCFQRLTAALMILLVGSVSALASLSIVWWTRSHVDAVLWLMPPLVFVLGMSGAVYLLSQYRRTVDERGLAGAPARAAAQAAPTCILATASIAAGLFALCVSENLPVRKFGYFAALGVLATLVVLFTFLPSALQIWSWRREPTNTEPDASTGSRAFHGAWRSIGSLAVNHNWWVAAAALALMIGLGLNVGQLKSSVQPLRLFRPETKVIRDYSWLETHVGKPVPMEVVIEVDKQRQASETPAAPAPEATVTAEIAPTEYPLTLLERVELVAHVQSSIDRVFGAQGQDLLGPALSAATFAPPILDPLSPLRTETNTTLQQQRDEWRRAGYLAVGDDGAELWRINVRLSALGNVDYGRFIAQLKQVVEPVLKAYELRDEILSQVARQRPDITDPDARWQNTRIAILGAPDPRDAAGDITTTVELPEIGPTGATADAVEDENRLLGVHREVARILGDLLRAKGYQGIVGRRAPSQFIGWQDPRRNPFNEGYAHSEEWAKQLAQLDCVVVLRDHPDYDMDFIRQHAKSVVDARAHTFRPAEEQTAHQLDKPIGVFYTGTVPILYRAEQMLMQSLLDSAWWSFVAIAVIMMLATRTRRWQPLNVRGGLTAMIPALFTVTVMFGELGRRQFSLDIGTLMTAGAAMGATVVGTFQFVTAFRRAARQGLDRPRAILTAFEGSSRIILLMTLVAGSGLAAFALGTFVPTQWFGITMLAMLATALVANLVLLPALLAGPLGRYLCPIRVAGEAEQPPARDADLDSSSEAGRSTLAAGFKHTPQREGRAASVVRRDGSH